MRFCPMYVCSWIANDDAVVTRNLLKDALANVLHDLQSPNTEWTMTVHPLTKHQRSTGEDDEECVLLSEK